MVHARVSILGFKATFFQLQIITYVKMAAVAQTIGVYFNVQKNLIRFDCLWFIKCLCY